MNLVTGHSQPLSITQIAIQYGLPKQKLEKAWAFVSQFIGGHDRTHSFKQPYMLNSSSSAPGEVSHFADYGLDFFDKPEYHSSGAPTYPVLFAHLDDNLALSGFTANQLGLNKNDSSVIFAPNIHPGFSKLAQHGERCGYVPGWATARNPAINLWIGRTLKGLTMVDLKGARVLELGSADAIPSTYALKNGAAHATVVDMDAAYYPVVAANLEENEINPQKLQFIEANLNSQEFWKHILQKDFDIVIANLGRPNYYNADILSALGSGSFPSLRAFIGSGFLSNPKNARNFDFAMKHTPLTSLIALIQNSRLRQYRMLTGLGDMKNPAPTGFIATL